MLDGYKIDMTWVGMATTALGAVNTALQITVEQFGTLVTCTTLIRWKMVASWWHHGGIRRRGHKTGDRRWNEESEDTA